MFKPSTQQRRLIQSKERLVLYKGRRTPFPSPEYLKALSKLNPELREPLLEGSWDIKTPKL